MSDDEKKKKEEEEKNAKAEAADKDDEAQDDNEANANIETLEEAKINVQEAMNFIGFYDVPANGWSKIHVYALFSKEFDSEIQPTIDFEHDDWGWFEINSLPNPTIQFVLDGIERLKEAKLMFSN